MAENNEPHGAAVNLDLTGEETIIELTDVAEAPTDSDIIDFTSAAGVQGESATPQPIEIAADSPIIDSEEESLESTDAEGSAADDGLSAPLEIAADSPIAYGAALPAFNETADESMEEDVIELTEVAADNSADGDAEFLDLMAGETDSAADDDIIELNEVAADSLAVDDEPILLTDVVDEAGEDEVIQLTEVVTDPLPADEEEVFDLSDAEDDAAVEEMTDSFGEPADYTGENSVLDEDELSELSGITETLEDDGAYTLPGLVSDSLVSDDDEFADLTNQLDSSLDDAIIDLSDVAADSSTDDTDVEAVAEGVLEDTDSSFHGAQSADSPISDDFTELPELAETDVDTPGLDEAAKDEMTDTRAEEVETLVFPDSSAGPVFEAEPAEEAVEAVALEPEQEESEPPAADAAPAEPETLVFPGTAARDAFNGADEAMEGDQGEQEESTAWDDIGTIPPTIDVSGQTDEEDTAAGDMSQGQTPDAAHEELISLIHDTGPEEDDGFLKADDTEAAFEEESLMHTEPDGHLLDPDEEFDIPSEDATAEDHEAGTLFAESLDDDLDAAFNVSAEDDLQGEVAPETEEELAGIMSVQIENQRDEGLVDFKFESRLHPGEKVYKEKELGALDVSVSQEQVEDAVRQVVREMFSERIDTVLDDIIKKTIADEIKKIKDVLLKE